METTVRGGPNKRPRELGKRGTAGSFIAAFGLLWTLSYFVVLSWITSLLVDSLYYLWRFTSTFGWTILLGGAIVFTVGAGIMISDWKRREPEMAAVPTKVKGVAGYDTTHPQMEYHLEA